MTHDMSDNPDGTIDDLDSLIRFLEDEKERTKHRVEEAARAWEFGEAKAHARMHRQIARRIYALKNLRDPAYEERGRLYRLLIRLEEDEKAYAVYPDIIARTRAEIKQVNETLDKLESSRHFPLDTQHIDDAVFQLVDGTLDRFRLHVNKGEEVVLDFTLTGPLLEIGLSYKKGAIFRSMKKELRRLRFTKTAGMRRFFRHIDITTIKDAIRIKQLLAVVLFDVFGHTWFDHPAQLELTYKREKNISDDEDDL